MEPRDRKGHLALPARREFLALKVLQALPVKSGFRAPQGPKGRKVPSARRVQWARLDLQGELRRRATPAILEVAALP